MTELILKICQPIACGTFIVSGICCLMLGYKHKGVLNICFGISNVIVFYGDKIWKT